MSQLNFTDPSSYASIQAIQPDLDAGYALIDAPGSDAGNFLQGQLTSDIASLPVGQCLPAALCNPQGRVIAHCEVLHRAEAHFQLMLPAALADGVLTLLKRYVFRSKVTLSLLDQPVGVHSLARLSPGEISENDTGYSWRPSWNSASDWAFTSHPIDTTLPAIRWDQAHWLWAQAPLSSEQYLPQMLNLDVLGAVHFQKGCYTGQEVIARVHFRGSVKRRLRRFVIATNTELEPAANITTADGTTAGEIISVCYDDAGHTGVLAMMRAAHWDEQAEYAVDGLSLSHQALPYVLPDTAGK